MKTKAAILAILTVIVIAQDPLSGLPECGKQCFEDGFKGSGCASKSDFKCTCGSKNFINDMTGCMLIKCGGADM
ncbi:hypothetical protein PWT90_00111 [Aphanocladium album]|nr:hypothetical protein PWT90_00111 [Aphanocladium album]